LTAYSFSGIIEENVGTKYCTLQKAKIQYYNEIGNGKTKNSIDKLMANNDADEAKNLISLYSSQYFRDYFSIRILIKLMNSMVSRKKEHDYK